MSYSINFCFRKWYNFFIKTIYFDVSILIKYFPLTYKCNECVIWFSISFYEIYCYEDISLRGSQKFRLFPAWSITLTFLVSDTLCQCYPQYLSIKPHPPRFNFLLWRDFPAFTNKSNISLLQSSSALLLKTFPSLKT